jgi:hypothetical protein
VLCCEVFYREACCLVAASKNTCDIEFLPRGLHDLGSERMSALLQERIDAAQEGRYEAVCLVYGLCNNGVIGLVSRAVKLVIPRVHDCIAVFLGSHARYKEYFDAHPGTWYRTTGWYERFDPRMEGETRVAERIGLTWERQKLVEKYGEENADYILETLGDPTAHYSRLAFIAMGLPCEAEFERKAREEAEQHAWAFDRVEGSMDMLRKLIEGEWDKQFLVLEPGRAVEASHDNCILKCAGGGCSG